MKKEDFYFDLPEELIAQTPLKDRTTSKLMVVNKKTGDVNHKTFSNILDYFNEGDCLVINETKVIPARLFGNKKTGAKIEVLLLDKIDLNKYEVLVNPGRKAKVGDTIYFGDILEGTVVDIVEDGNRIIEFKYDGVFENILDQLGEMPLPPYIKEKLNDKDRYQTVYAKNDGSSAAPTAGLHFTNDLMEQIKAKGVNIVKITLHVGLGTFRPVKVTNILEHKMHSEKFFIDEMSAKIINDTKKRGKKVFSVGTTSTRALESSVNEEGLIESKNSQTNIFIYPGYKFKVVDSLITNFHLPESTLIMLVSALSSKDNILNAYNEAIKHEYRFFSFGDAMLID